MPRFPVFAMSPEMAALRFHRFLVRFAGALVSAFLWIFIFFYFLSERLPPGDALAHALFLYALSEIVTLAGTPLAFRYFSRSMLRGVVFGTAFLALAFGYVGAFSMGLFPNGAAVIGVLLGLYRALYHGPYALERAFISHVPSRGFAPDVALALAPALAGAMLVSGFPFSSLMFFAAFTAVASLAPIPLIPNVRERFAWSYRETFRQLLREGNAGLVAAAMLRGAKDAALIVLWPLALLFLGIPNPLVLGALVSAALVAAAFLGAGKRFSLVIATADGGTYLDEYTALKEMGGALGRALIACLIAALALLS